MRKIIIDQKEVEYELVSMDEQNITLRVGGKDFTFTKGKSSRPGEIKLVEGKKRQRAFVGPGPDSSTDVFFSHMMARVASPLSARKASSHKGDGGYLSPMPGKIFKVLVEEGQEVKKGQALIVLEAMKMEHSLNAQTDGVVEKIHYKVGDLVQGGVELLAVTSSEQE